MKGLWLVVLLGIAGNLRDYDREITHQRQELDALRSQLEAGQKELAALKARKSATLEELDRLSGHIALTQRYLRQLQVLEQQLQQSVAATRQSLDSIDRRLQLRQRVMAQRVRLLFMAGPPENLLLAPLGEGDFFQRAYLVKRIVRYDHTLAEQCRRDRDLKRQTLAQLAARRAELVQFQQRRRSEMVRYTRAQNDEENTLHALEHSESAKAETLRQLQENARALNDIIAALEKRRREERQRSRRKALVLEKSTHYCAPVDGPVVSRYGMQYHASLGISTRNLGIEMEAAPGTPVRAAVSGEVALITRIPGYGPGVILDNGSGYFTIYANLGAIRVRLGERVKTCQEIAAVASDAANVYFEVRQGTRTLDPTAWLKGEEENASK